MDEGRGDVIKRIDAQLVGDSAQSFLEGIMIQDFLRYTRAPVARL